MRIIQISDTHFTKISYNPRKLCSKRLIGTLNWVFSREKQYSHASLESLPALFHSLKADFILAAGDLTSTSLPTEFEIAKRYFDKIRLPKIFIPGNHDQYTKKAHVEKRFYKTFANIRQEIKHRVEFFTLKDHGIEAHRLRDNWWCVALDTAPATSAASSIGHFSKQLQIHLEEVLHLIGLDQHVIVLNHFPFFDVDPPSHRLSRASDLKSLVKAWPNIRLYLHGHTHRRTVADLQPSGFPIVLDGGCPIELSQGSWNLIDVSSEGCLIQPYSYENNGWTALKSSQHKWIR